MDKCYRIKEINSGLYVSASCVLNKKGKLYVSKNQAQKKVTYLSKHWEYKNKELYSFVIVEYKLVEVNRKNKIKNIINDTTV